MDVKTSFGHCNTVINSHHHKNIKFSDMERYCLTPRKKKSVMQFRTLEFKDYNIFESIKVNTVRDGYLHACLEVLYEMQVEPNSMH